ncbi:MAG TPA: SDR family NAD(P)-dependent oxidoreductase, partial [Chloroflexota bacterium]|nr:SDR family NAD(P)-dependent oxidoreductase [Chloroflexota bacterium]
MARENRRSVVITGASTGIGHACALHLDALGFRVFAGVRREADGDSLRRQASDRLTPLILDVTDEATIEAASEHVHQAMGDAGVSGLVNNAGIAIGGPLELIQLDDLRRQLEVNVIGQVAVTQAFLPLLRHGRGRIVNMGSISGRVAGPFVGPYAASKFAMEALTDSLRLELRPWGVHVAIVEPGVIATPIWEKSLSTAQDMLERLPAERRQRLETLYGSAMDRMRLATQGMSTRGVSPVAVARAVEHALVSP